MSPMEVLWLVSFGSLTLICLISQQAAYRNGIRDGLARRLWLPDVRKVWESEFNPDWCPCGKPQPTQEELK